MTVSDAKPVLKEDKNDATTPPSDLPSKPSPLSRADAPDAQQKALSQRLESLVNDTQDWAQLVKTEQADSFSQQLRELYENFSLPLDETRQAKTENDDNSSVSDEEELREALRETFPASDATAKY